MKYYAIKFLRNNGEAPTMGFKYELPVDGNPGKWYSKYKKKIECCGNGFHASTLDGISEWYNHYYTENIKCFVVEIFGKISHSVHDDKISCEHMRVVCEIPLKPVKVNNKGIRIYYAKENIKAIKNFCKSNNYAIVDTKLFTSMLPNKCGGYTLKGKK